MEVFNGLVLLNHYFSPCTGNSNVARHLTFDPAGTITQTGETGRAI